MNANAPMLATLENYLQLTTSRERAISANMANVDTPGFQTKDIDFQSELNRAVTQASMMSEEGNQGLLFTPVVREVRGLMQRADGNNVSLDREGLMLGETQLQYQIGIQLIKNHFHGLLQAINGGGS